MSVSAFRAGATKLVSPASPLRSAYRRDRAPLTLPPPRSAADRNAALLLTLLGDGDLTIADLLAHGVKSPAQGLYELQLAGHVIERVRITRDGERSAVNYRLYPRR